MRRITFLPLSDPQRIGGTERVSQLNAPTLPLAPFRCGHMAVGMSHVHFSHVPSMSSRQVT